MNQSWKNDPRLKDLDPRKLDLLSSFASRISQMPKGQLLTAFADLNLEAQKAGLAFTDQETQLIVSILTGRLSPGERRKLDTLQLLSKKLSRQKGKEPAS